MPQHRWTTLGDRWPLAIEINPYASARANLSCTRPGNQMDGHAGVCACNYIRCTYVHTCPQILGVYVGFRGEAKWNEKKKKKTVVVVVVGDEECAKLLGQLTVIRRRQRRRWNSSHRKILNNIQCLQNILVFVSVQTQWAHIYPPIVRKHITTTCMHVCAYKYTGVCV